MGLEEVKAEIEQRTKEECARIINQAEEEAKRIILMTRAKLAEEEAAEEEDTQKIIASLERTEIASTELELKKRRFQLKKQLIDEVFAKALGDLQGQKLRHKYLAALEQKAKRSIAVHTVYANEKDKDAFTDYACKAAPISGGLIAENKEGIIRVDFSYEALMESLKERLLADVAKLLFDDEDRH